MGLTGQWNFNRATGELTLPSWVDEAQVKREYSKAAVNRSAKKNGWLLKWKKNDQELDEAEVVRRHY